MIIKLEDINNTGHGPLYIGQRSRLAGCTSVKLINHEYLLACSFVGKRMYLVHYDMDGNRHRVTSCINTQYRNQDVSTDLVDFDGHNLILTSNAEQSSLTMYRLNGDQLEFVKDVPIADPRANFCHGVKFVPPDGKVVCATCTLDGRCTYFISAESNAILYQFSDGEWKPKDICFISPRRMLVVYAKGSATREASHSEQSKISYLSLDLENKTHAVLDEIVLEKAHLDCCQRLGDKVYVSDQLGNRVIVCRVTGEKLVLEPEITGFDFPHGVDVLPGTNLMAVTNYGNNTIVLDEIPSATVPLRRESSVLAVVTHYGCEQWLARCLEALVTQTRPPENIVVIDDASPVPPVEILKNFPQVTLLVAEKNVGPYRLLQEIFNRADYDAYLLQDADDWSTPDRLERLLAAAARSGAELIGCQVENHFEGIAPEPPETYPTDVKAALVANPIYHPLLLATSVFTRDLVQRLGGLATGLRYGGDSEFIRRAVFAAKVINVSQPCYHRRIHPNAATRHPATGYNTPARLTGSLPIRERSKQNFAAAARGEMPDLAPFAVNEPVALKHIGGPQLREKYQPAQLTVPSRKPPVFIVGMHRSGTSLTANLLRQGGLWLGREDELHGATPDNPDGHWENIAVTEISDKLLNELGGGWDDVPEYPTGWPTKFPGQSERAKEIHAALARPTPWGWKDPRASLLMPFWLALEPAARVVICIRHPLEVANSLQRRGMMSYSLGLKLWRDYNERLLADVPPAQRIVVHYEHFFTQPLNTLKRVVEFCGLNISEAEMAKLAATAKPELRHTRFTAEQLARTAVAPEIIALYTQLCMEAGFDDVPKPAALNGAHSPRQINLDALSYEMFLPRWRDFVHQHTPSGARVAVVSKGDEELLRLHQRQPGHFPRDEQGCFLGYHPADSAEAIAQLTAVRAAGAQFFLLPEPSLWWLDCYPEFHRHLEKQFTRLEADRQIGVIYDLRHAANSPE